MSKLTPVQQKFILHWGEMGTSWGINRTVAQVHALLFISPKPLNAEDIVETLSVARSNVSTSIKELLGWGIVRRVHVLGDQRDHFESMKDVWEMFQVVLDERRKREIDPTLALLRECAAEADKARLADALLVEADCRPRLVSHGPGKPYHFHYAPVMTGLAARVRALTAAGALPIYRGQRPRLQLPMLVSQRVRKSPELEPRGGDSSGRSFWPLRDRVRRVVLAIFPSSLRSIFHVAFDRIQATALVRG